MPDQAQGLRVLVDQSRRDHNAPSSASTEAQGLSGSIGATRFPSALSSVESGEPGVALADTRLHSAASPRARVLAVTSGKGGVGKTSFSSNLALTLARTGKRVIVLDADLGLANLHLVLGVQPRYHLEHVMRGEKTLRDILYPGPGGVLIIAGGSGIVELANLDEATRLTFLEGLKSLDTLADIILIDTGAGLSRSVMAFLAAVEEIIVVTTPEPTAVMDAYATIKVTRAQNPDAHLRLIVNMARTPQEAQETAERLNRLSRQFLQGELDYLGGIPYDQSVGQAVRTRIPFVLGAPHTAASQAIEQVAAQLGYRQEEAPTPRGIGNFLSRLQRFCNIRR